MNLDTLEAALELLGRGSSFAWLTVVESVGSSPRHAGASMLVRTDGTTAGTIGGGSLEAEAIGAGLEAIAARQPRLLRFDLTNEDSAGQGMICGGSGMVLIDHVDPGDEPSTTYFTALHDTLQKTGKGWTVVTIPSEPAADWRTQKCLVREDKSVAGDPACSADVLWDALKPSGARTVDLAGPGSITYIHPVGRRGAAYTFGAGHCGEKLVPILSSVGFYTVVIDDREEFANEQRFPSADEIVVPDSFSEVIHGLPIDNDSYLVIVTRGHLQDRNVLQQALETDATYIGMIGSKKKVADTFAALREDGVSEESIARVHAPIGLPIGAETPEEIAVSIAAEIIHARASRKP